VSTIVLVLAGLILALVHASLVVLVIVLTVRRALIVVKCEAIGARNALAMAFIQAPMRIACSEKTIFHFGHEREASIAPMLQASLHGAAGIVLAAAGATIIMPAGSVTELLVCRELGTVWAHALIVRKCEAILAQRALAIAGQRAPRRHALIALKCETLLALRAQAIAIIVEGLRTILRKACSGNQRVREATNAPIFEIASLLGVAVFVPTAGAVEPPHLV
jgi:hypothetical protein